MPTQSTTRPKILNLRRCGEAAVPLLGWLFIVLDDRTAARHSLSTPMIAAFDEPAHLTTALIAVVALFPKAVRSRHPYFFAAALVGSVAIDVDHLPMYLGAHGTTVPGGRPFTHSVATAIVLASLALTRKGRVREVLGGLSLGVLLHLVRDLGTGPGAPALWPLSHHSFLATHETYLSGVLALAGVIACRALFPENEPSRRVKENATL